MLEEAIGTSLYEDKRTSCQKTIEKKNSKLVEIQTVITHEVIYLIRYPLITLCFSSLMKKLAQT